MPQPVRRVYIPKASGGQRPLGIPTVRDRVVQQALRLVLEPVFEPLFCDSSFGFRPGRSAHQALDRVSAHLKQGYKWVVDCDLKSYFDTIPQEALIDRVAEEVADGTVLKLIRSFLQAGVMSEGQFQRTIAGTPQGGVVSPLLANIYLHSFDQLIQARGLRMTRYADDCAPRRQKGRPMAQGPCLTEDEGRPLGAAMQVEAPNHRKLLWSKAMVVSVTEKAERDSVR